MNIRKPITEDGRVGYDQFNQLVLETQRGEWTTMTFIADVREKICAICKQGWQPNGDSMGDQYFWRRFDEWTHESCFIRYGALQDRDLFYHALLEAKVRFGKLIPIENQYWPPGDPWYQSPWYEAVLPDAPAKFVLGARKRVYHIEVQPTEGKLDWDSKAAQEFGDENVTKYFGPDSILLHAWTREKVFDYVKRLVKLGGYSYRETPNGM